MALDKVSQRLVRITQALRDAGVAHALVGGQAVALWVATRDEAAVRTTKDVDIMIRRSDLGAARAVAQGVVQQVVEQAAQLGLAAQQAELASDAIAPDDLHAQAVGQRQGLGDAGAQQLAQIQALRKFRNRSK